MPRGKVAHFAPAITATQTDIQNQMSALDCPARPAPPRPAPTVRRGPAGGPREVHWWDFLTEPAADFITLTIWRHRLSAVPDGVRPPGQKRLVPKLLEAGEPAHGLLLIMEGRWGRVGRQRVGSRTWERAVEMCVAQETKRLAAALQERFPAPAPRQRRARAPPAPRPAPEKNFVFPEPGGRAAGQVPRDGAGRTGHCRGLSRLSPRGHERHQPQFTEAHAVL